MLVDKISSINADRNSPQKLIDWNNLTVKPAQQILSISIVLYVCQSITIDTFITLQDRIPGRLDNSVLS